MSARLAPHSSPRFAPLHPGGDDTATLPVPGYRQCRTYSFCFASALMDPILGPEPPLRPHPARRKTSEHRPGFAPKQLTFEFFLG